MLTKMRTFENSFKKYGASRQNERKTKLNIIQKKMRTVALNRQGQVETAQLRYTVNMISGEEIKDDEMLLGVFEHAPANIGSAVKSGIELVDCKSPDVFEIAVNYTTVAAETTEKSKRAAVRHGDRFWSSKCTLAKEKCYETPEKQKMFPGEGAVFCEAGYTALWNGKFGEDSMLEGVDKLVPRCDECCRKYIFASQCDTVFRRKIMDLVGKINSSSFRGWEAREVMLSKLEISEPFKNDLDQMLVELECVFSVRRHRRDVNWCGIDVGKVQGWDNLWGTFNANPRTRGVYGNCAYVGRLYDTGDFGILGLEE